VKFIYSLKGLLICACIVGCGSNHQKTVQKSAQFEASIDTTQLSYDQLKSLKEQWESTWLAPEMEARIYEKQLNKFWDGALAGASFWDLMAGFTPELLELPSVAKTHPIVEGRWISELGVGGSKLSGSEVMETIDAYRRQGWEIIQQEYRMFGFRADSVHPESDVQIQIYAENQKQQRRSFISGSVTVIWEKSETDGVAPRPHQIIWKNGFSANSENSPPRFTQVLDLDVQPESSSQFVDPLLIADLDKDGSDEIILPGANKIYFWDSQSGFQTKSLLSVNSLLEVGVIFDVDLDGTLDLVSATHGSALVFHGDGKGGFAIPPTLSEINDLKAPTGVAAADINQDGLTDLWLGQYLWPYEANKSPSPFDDANDGLPSYLLLNQGNGKFKDVTEGSGLDEKRYRRVYTGAFLDFDLDGLVDFIQVNDFDGLDYYKGEPGGKFKLMTESFLGETRAFGMSHHVGDLNGDSYPDICMFGMAPKTASRMSQMGVAHPDFPSVIESRKAMTYGNRIWTNQGSDQWQQHDWGSDFRDTGWTWGNSLGDFDNDGEVELYVANGYMSNLSSEDLDGDFWRFIVYTVGSTDEAMSQYLHHRSQKFSTESISLGGHHHNVFLHRTPIGWKDLAWLDGVALPDDSLNTATIDFNQDGALDLVVVTQSIVPETSFRLRVFENSGSPNNWIGIRLDREPGKAPWGTRVDLKMNNGSTKTSWVISSQGYRTQPGAFAHFGLGSEATVKSALITWPDKTTTEISSPEVNQWIRIDTK
jgi:enediyne biosynthesis protein E4